MSNELSKYVRQYCRKHNTTLEKLAVQAGIARGTLYHFLNKDTWPKITHLLQLAQAMNVHHNLLLRLKCSEFGVLHMPIAQNGEAYITQVQQDACGFIDETIPDGSIVTAGSCFDKSWTLQNLGDITWQNRYLLCLDEPAIIHHYPNGHSVSDYQIKPARAVIPIDTTAPKEKVTLSMQFTAPKVAGRYISYWKMVDEQGCFCYPNAIGVSLQILVLSTGICDG